MRYLLLIFIAALFCRVDAQEIINGSYDFQTDPEKKYTLYIPSGYDATVPSKVIVGLHPWNTSKWDSESWAEELSEIAEANNCIVICPDGGSDGQIDDDIDTAFTTFLIDEMMGQYNLDASKMYLVGFSWGGKTVYTYGLNHVERFAGFMPMGAAVEQSEVVNFASQAKDQYFYIIHGSQDSPNVRFTPLVNLLEDNMACVETNLLNGVGHTIEFDNQFNILNEGLTWLMNATPCNTVHTVDQLAVQKIGLKRSVISGSDFLEIDADVPMPWVIYDLQGSTLMSGKDLRISQQLAAGAYIIQIADQAGIRFVVQ